MGCNSRRYVEGVMSRLLPLSTATVVLAITAVLAFTVACSTGATSGNGETLTVFAASSLTEAFKAVATSFEAAHPETSVALNFAGSQQLRVQLEHGASADLYASADPRQMSKVETIGLLFIAPVNFASNAMVVIASTRAGGESGGHSRDELPPGPSPAPSMEVSGDASGIQSLADLAGKGAKLVLAQPEVPAGSYSRTVIASLAEDPSFGPRFSERVLANVVSHEPNVRSVLQKVALGEADAGMVYLTDATPASGVRVIPLPDWANVEAAYPVAILRDGSQKSMAEAFIDFLTSPEGQSILQEHGFGPAPAGPEAGHRPTWNGSQDPGMMGAGASSAVGAAHRNKGSDELHLGIDPGQAQLWALPNSVSEKWKGQEGRRSGLDLETRGASGAERPWWFRDRGHVAVRRIHRVARWGAVVPRRSARELLRQLEQ